MRRIALVILIGLLVAGSYGCASMGGTEKGLMIGAAAGAVIGGAVAENTAAGAILGAAIGGAAGATIGHYMDDQAEELENDLEGAKIERIGEGIKITFESGILFDVDKAELRPAAKENLVKMAGILNKYEDTNILIEGHTDSDGSEEYNLALSERRSHAVTAFLAMNNVSSARITEIGYGETQPIADNSTAEGKQANRRVEVAIMANEELKERALEEAQG
jgi:outer membrane protein OmpA-like peptidoglycan-associated protein